MTQIRQHLIRANAIARLDAIMRELDGASTVASPYREWFADLLHPLTKEAGATKCSLRVSRDVTPFEGSALLSMLVREFPNANNSSALEDDIERLCSLREHLLNNEPMTLDQKQVARDIVKRFRRHFVGVSTPTKSGFASLRA